MLTALLRAEAHRVESASAIACGLVVGLSLGLTGGGGAILAVPLLVYVLGLQFRAAVALSLAIVGATALYGALAATRRGSVRWAAGLILGASGALCAPLGAFLGARLSDRASMLAFAVVMLAVAVRMLRDRTAPDGSAPPWFACQPPMPGQALRISSRCALKLLIAGALTGTLSGVFGVGGGFLLVPVLTAVLWLPMGIATATSLVAITVISASALAANASHLNSDASTTGLLVGFGALAGMTGSSLVRSRLDERSLRRTFGLLVLVAVAVTLAQSL